MIWPYHFTSSDVRKYSGYNIAFCASAGQDQPIYLFMLSMGSQYQVQIHRYAFKRGSEIMCFGMFHCHPKKSTRSVRIPARSSFTIQIGQIKEMI